MKPINKHINRRKFLTGAGAGVAGLAAMAHGGEIDNGTKNQHSKKIRESVEADVVVVGAGAAGVPAAIGAARSGAKVVLLEEDMVPGGAPVDYFVTMPCGGPMSGIYLEMLNIIKKEYAQKGCSKMWFLPSAYVAAIWKMAKAEKNLQIICGAKAVAVDVADDGGRARVSGVLVDAGVGMLKRINAAVTIDATGTGAVSELAGCKSMYGRDSAADFSEPNAPEKADDMVQQLTWQYISQKIGDRPAFDMMKLENVRLGVFDDDLAWFHSNPQRIMKIDNGIYLHWGCKVRCRDTRDPAAIADAQRQGYSLMERDIALLKENGYAVHLAPKIGVREVRRVVGEHVITENDLRSGKLPDDTIAVGNYGLDIWGQDVKAGYTVPGYGIPYRALIAKDYEGLLLAGKIISGTHVAMGGYRVQPIASGIGQSAGVAAAMAAQANCPVRDISVTQLQDRVKKMGLKITI